MFTNLSDLFTFPNIIYVVVGLVISLCVGRSYTKNLLDGFVTEVGKKIIPKLTETGQINQWNLVSDFGFTAGGYIATIERIIFFFAILLSKELIVGAWLTFKIASKWESWTNIVRVPTKKDDKGAFDFTIRRYWGTLVMQRFIIGTGLNLLFAGVGVFTTYALGPIIDLICTY